MPGETTVDQTLVRLIGVAVCAEGTPLLSGITLALESGAPTALIGPNGSGKTTLLRLIMGLVAPAEGRLERSNARCALVFQKPVMLRRSVADNIAFALHAAGEPADASNITGLLDRVGLTPIARRPARLLSGGEQQRLAIARALARRPELLLLDEATASLDPAQTKLVEDLIGRIAATGVKIVFSTHDLGQARRLADEIVLMVKGRMVERCAAATFFAGPVTEAGRRFVGGDLVL